MAEQGRDLQDDDDAADAGHETRNHRERHQADIAPELENPEQHLEEPAQHDHGEGQGGIVSILGDDPGHHHGHRSGRSRNLSRGAAEQGGEKADENGAVQPRHRPRPRGHAEGQSQRQRHHRGGQAAVDVAAKTIEIQAVNKPHNTAPPRFGGSISGIRCVMSPIVGLSSSLWPLTGSRTY